ncbi:hypothetical protein [Pseudoalteromonas prydzensis]|uniref:hypothetical protein n=1 Tax=Pseudoalteromonas prydzensis TaxID=182141 RepID=UPI0024BD4874|nr:hypothetical protein [Pseudoalteromonas prydzensis]
MEIELLDELQNTKFDEEDLRKEIALHLQKADAIKREYEDKSLNGLKEIESLQQSLLDFPSEERELKARVAAITDLYPHYTHLADDITEFENTLHKEVYTKSKRLKKIEFEKVRLPKRITEIGLEISEIKKAINEKLEPIEDIIKEVNLKLDTNLIHQEKLKKVLNPDYNNKSEFEKKLDDQNSDLYLILAIIFLLIISPFFGFLPLIAISFALYKLNQNRQARSRARSHKERV